MKDSFLLNLLNLFDNYGTILLAISLLITSIMLLILAKFTLQKLAILKHYQKTEQLLSETNQRLKTILDSLETIIYVADFKTHEILFANQHLKNTFGEEVSVEKKCWQILHDQPTDLCESCEHCQWFNNLTAHKAHTWEAQSNLNHHWYYIHNRLITWTDGRLVRLEIATDITERKHIENSLQQSEKKYRQLYETLQEAILNIDLQGHILEFNPPFQQLLGYSKTELYQLHAQTITPGKWHKMEERITQEQVMLRGYSDVYEKEYFHKNGHVFPVEVRRYLLTDEQGQPIGIWEFIRDITERKWAQEKLRLASAYNRSLIEASLDPLVTITPTGKISDSNLATEMITGYSHQELFGAYFANYFTQPEQAKVAIRKVFIQGKLYDCELEIRHRQGRTIPVLCNASLYCNEQGEVIGVFIAARDITQQKQAQEELRQAKEAAELANQAKSSFLANMSHELRTPLNSILGYTQILRRDNTLTSKQQEGINIIHRSGEYLLTLINDILDLSKVEAGKIELYPSYFGFSEFLEGINELFRLRAQQKGIGYIYQPLSPMPAGVYADEKRLRQVLINLLSNAIKFTDQGEVILKLSRVGEDKILFQVEDTGVGIAPQDQSKIFLPFHQTGEQYHRTEGTGLGLSITKKLVELMEGTLQVESVLGKGSLFWMVLSLPEVQTFQSVANELQPIIGFEGTLKRLLIVDDEWQNRSVLVNFLSPLGFEVYEASNGQEGLDKACFLKPDLVITDLVMPIIDGFQMIRELRKLPKFKELPIVVTSASVFEHHQQESLVAGSNAFLPKPIQFEELLTVLQTQLHLSWRYDSKGNALHLNFTDPTQFTGPSSEQAKSLYELLFSDELSKVVTTAEHLAQHTPELKPFAAYLRELANGFQEERICQLLESYL